MDKSYLYENEKYKKIAELIEKIVSSMNYCAPEMYEHKKLLLAEKYSHFFVFEEE